MQTLLLALAVLPPLLQGPKLDEARKLLAGRTEGDVTRGAQMCVDANNAEGAEAMLKILAQSQPHFRDIVFEHLEKLRDPYAIGVVEDWAESHKDADVRSWCADLLGAYADAKKTQVLLKGLADPAVEVRIAAARALGRLAVRDSASRLAGLRTHADAMLRATATVAWGLCDPEKNAKGYLEKLADKDAGVRTTVLAVLPRVAPTEIYGRSKAALADKDWRVRLQAVQNLQSVRTKDSVTALVGAVGDPRRVVAQAAEHALAALTGKLIAGQKAWQGWWEANEATFDLPSAPTTKSEGAKEAESQGTGVFFGLPIESDHVAFLIDRGATMANPSLNGSGSKMEEVIGELKRTLEALPRANTFFNVYAYSGDVRAWEKKPKPVDEKSIASALQFLRQQSLAGRKNIWGALQAALDDPEIDTIYLMSDGEPEDGTYVHWNRVVDHLQRRNVARKVVVHTVSVSDPEWSDAVKEWYRSQLREIAKGTGGKYVEK